jgi:ubiquinone/menaquinone biosynthesis C-methylase UbiE
MVLFIKTMNTPPVCNYEGSDYQETFWEQGGRDYEDRAEQIALRRLLPPSGRRLLELGAGAGRNTPRYQGFEHVTLVDYSRSQLELARQRLGDSPRYTYVAANVYHLPFAEGVFDAATMIRTLHHMADAPLALAQTRACLKPGAVFILEFANKQNLKAIARYALGKQRWSPFSPEPVEFAALNFDFHPRSVRQWLTGRGFQVERQLTVSHFRIGLFKRLFPAAALAWGDSLAQLTGDWWQLSPSVFVRARAVGQTRVAGEGQFFRCPACGGALEAADEMGCACGKVWKKEEGIYDFRMG